MIAPKIMLVEDEGPLCALLRHNLEIEGYRVEVFNRGDEAEIRLQEHLPDLLVLDWTIPAVSGMELWRRLRARPETKRLPVIVLMGVGEQSHRARGSSTSPDDYLAKPFSPSELIARVRALLRRIKPEVLSDVLIVHDTMLDRRQHQVFRKSRPVQLSVTEFRLLEFMMQHPGRVFSREELVDAIWGKSEYVEGRALDVLVLRLRKSLNAGSDLDLIRTIRGAGYAIGSANGALPAVR